VSYLEIKQLTKYFDGKPRTTAVDGVDLVVEQGEFLVLLGPSGCGKTTTLRCLAGLEIPDAGSIAFGDSVVVDSDRRIMLPANKRNIGMVFQSYALWPHMTVRKNIAFPLRARRVRGTEGWVEEAARLVECENLLDRYPAQLSGGQQQRVALARALVARPDLILFDEPLSNLDARLRDQVRDQIHELHQKLRFTAVFVTHDQSEALALGTRLAVMRAGSIEQFDTPRRVFSRPSSEEVASFIGMSNRLVLERAGEGAVCFGAEVRNVRTPPGQTQVAARIRPEDIRLFRQGRPIPLDLTTVGATVVTVEFGGRHIDVVVSIGGHRVSAKISIRDDGVRGDDYAPGDAVVVGFSPGDVVHFGQDGRLIESTGDLKAPVSIVGAG
jgi:iron(III) transport system ATP-binding protein